MAEPVKEPLADPKMEPQPPATSVYASGASTQPQMSMGRWVKDSDLEAQAREHSKVSLSSTDGALPPSFGPLWQRWPVVLRARQCFSC